MKHTPGPWKFRHHETGADEIYTDDREATIALVYSGGVWASEVGLDDKNAVKYANAKLIAAAPELLNALINMRKEFDKSNEKYADWVATKEVYDAMSIIDQAIKKATA